MVSLGETYDGRPKLDDRLRLYIGTAFLLAGTFVATIGLAGVVADGLAALGLSALVARQAAVAVSALLVPALFATSLLWLPADRPIRVAAGAGMAVVALSVALFLFTVSPEALAPPVRLPGTVLVLYAIGAGVAVWSPIGTAAAVVIDRETSTGAGSVAYHRSRDGDAAPGRVPADGGTDEDDLSFLLDEDDDRRRGR